MTKKETIKKILPLIEWLQDNTNLIYLIPEYDYSDEATNNFPEGDYARIERWLLAQDNIESLNELLK